MEPQQILSMLRRRGWLILCWTLALGAIVGVVSDAIQTPVYESGAQVLLRPNDPTQSLSPPAANQTDPTRYAGAQVAIIRSLAVARGASAGIRGHPSPAALLGHVRVVTSSTSSILTIVGSAEQPAQAQAIANAFANAYVANRRGRALSNLRSAIDDITHRLDVLQTQMTAATTKAERDAAAQQYQSLFSKREELNVNVELTRGDAELVGEAGLPSAPVSPKPKRDAALGATAGLLIGLGIELLRLKFGDKVRTAEELEQITTHQVLAELPEDSTVSSAATPDLKRASAFSEALRTLRTSLQFLGMEHPVRRIVVSSASPGEGKTTVAAHLAVAYAAAGLVTVLVSGDLRRPQVENLFGAPRTALGLSTLLATTDLYASSAPNGEGELLEDMRAARRLRLAEFLRAQTVNTAINNLTVLPGGPPPPNPAELLGSSRMFEILDLLEAQADIVIIDTPPALVVTDAVVLARIADGVLIVAAAAQTRRRDLKRLVGLYDSLDVPVLGTVLNRARSGRRSASYYEYYAAPKRRAVRR